MGAQNRYTCVLVILHLSFHSFTHYSIWSLWWYKKWSRQVSLLLVSSSQPSIVSWSSQQIRMEKGLSQWLLWLAPKPPLAPFDELEKVSSDTSASIGFIGFFFIILFGIIFLQHCFGLHKCPHCCSVSEIILNSDTFLIASSTQLLSGLLCSDG